MKQNRGSRNTLICAQLIFYKDSKAIYQEKEVFSTNGARKNLYPNGKRKKERNKSEKGLYPVYVHIKKKKKPLTNQFLKRNNPIKEWAKNVNTSQRKKYDQPISTLKGLNTVGHHANIN